MKINLNVIWTRLVTGSFLISTMVFVASCSTSKIQSGYFPGSDEFTVMNSTDLQPLPDLMPSSPTGINSISEEASALPVESIALKNLEKSKSSETKTKKVITPRTRKLDGTKDLALMPTVFRGELKNTRSSGVVMATQDDSYLYVAIILILVGLIVYVVFTVINLEIIGAVIMLVGLIFLILWLVEYVDENA